MSVKTRTEKQQTTITRYKVEAKKGEMLIFYQQKVNVIQR